MQVVLELPIHIMPEMKQLHVMPDTPGTEVSTLVLPAGTQMIELPHDLVVVWDQTMHKMQIGWVEDEADSTFGAAFWADSAEKRHLACTPSGLWFVIGRMTIKQSGSDKFTARQMSAPKAHKLLAMLDMPNPPLSREELLAEAVLEAHRRRRRCSGTGNWVHHKQQQWAMAATWITHCFGKTDDQVESVIDDLYEIRVGLQAGEWSYAHCTWAIETLAGIIGADMALWTD